MDRRELLISRAFVGAAAIALCALALPPYSATAQVAVAEPEYTGTDRIEDWEDKTILIVAPHPDDDTFTSGGTLALLAPKNRIHVLIYTSDNAGSRDPSMTHQRLAAIRKAEEEEACRILGIPVGNITWLGYDDGMLEYVDRRELTKQVAAEIRRLRPDAVFSVDPGAPYEQWHKSDHRTGGYITADALRAAEWRLYFPELEAQGLAPWDVPVVFLYYSAQPNYTVDITAVIDHKVRAAAAHSSQFGVLVDRYDEERAKELRPELERMLKGRAPMENGRYVERFRRSEAY
ncbi:MAG TPA: PIG-L deacetylase family protein [Thermoanaerobaculia bacterium]|nr:PIG-L deacetylase family protein [Thermoanaerobaculia bacterium]